MPRIQSLVFALLLTYPVLAQEFSSPGAMYGKADSKEVIGYQSDYMRTFYYQNVDNIDELINGRDYIPYYFKSKLKPLLFPGRKHKSSLILNNRKYDNLMLEYDTFKDELIYSDSLKFIDSKVFKISLNKDLIDGFSFYFGTDSLIFRYFSQERNLNFNLPEGFYETGYDGRSKFIIRHRSYLSVKEGNDEYVYSPFYYIMIDSGYTKIAGKQAFLKLFGDDAGEIKKFMHINKVHIHRAGRNEIAAVLKYYDSLNLSNR
jgi:hypothetical protein